MIRTALLSAFFAVAAFGADYTIDGAHSSAKFAVRHMMVSNVTGSIGKITGTVSYDPKNPSATKVSATLETASIDTGEPKRDEHLRSADFFDVQKYPSIKFESTSAKKSGSGVEITGNLTLHGVTKPVTLKVAGPIAEVKDPWGNLRTGASATTVINRKDFGLTWNKALETGGMMVSDEVTLTLDIEATRKP